MQFFTTIIFALVAISAVSAQFYPWAQQFMPVDHLAPNLFNQGQPQFAEPGLFNYIPSAMGAQHTINRPPTPLGW
ncbi:hypothetical protein CAEBREN_22442 [Caenorhabditis brenneri]|uniref:Uncharacterized protein n=1 Tax=Caenorhabditis brenneri TaxID=135651 RepID=G0P3N7_CAEBE|nr:hypothetical protein CAEBREN_22442 [Caenorhabditis brenneri]